MKYTLEEHRHRFATWAAARAAQRAFTTSKNLIAALESCGVRQYLAKHLEDKIDTDKFCRLHKKWCEDIVANLKKARVKNVTWGRAAKLVAVYLKSMVILGAGSNSPLAHFAYPPVDHILLNNLAGCEKLQSQHQAAWGRIKWTKLDKKCYYQLIDQLRLCLPHGEPFWALEKHWFPVAE